MKDQKLIGILLTAMLLGLCACGPVQEEPDHTLSIQTASEVSLKPAVSTEPTAEPAEPTQTPEASMEEPGDASTAEPAISVPMPMTRDLEEIQTFLVTLPNSSGELMKRGDVVVESWLGSLDEASQALWDSFYASVQAGTEAAVTTVQFSIEGDAIPIYVHYNGSDFYVIEDTNRDAFGAAAYVEYTFLTLTERREEGGIQREDHYEKRIDTYYTLTDPVSASQPVFELDVLNTVAWEDMDILTLPEPTRDETAIAAYLASFPQQMDGLCQLDGVVLNWGRQSESENISWDLFVAGCENGSPASVTLVDVRLDSGPVLLYISYDGDDFFLAKDQSRAGGSGQLECWTLDELADVEKYLQENG